MKKQKLKSRTEAIVVTVAVIAVIALANYLSNRFFYRIDLTENRQFTVSDATKRVLRNLDDIVVIKAFFSKDLPPETHITVNTVRDLLAEYRNIAGGRLRVTWEDPAGNEEAINLARTLGVPEITLQTVKRDKVEAMRGYMGIGIMYADKSESIPVVQNLANLEYDLTQAIMKVKRSSIPKIGVLKSQSADFIPPEILGRMNMTEETTEKRFTPIFETLRHDYEVVAVDVSEGTAIDREIRTLIIPGGERFNARTLFEIDQYFMNGGNLIVMANGVNVTFHSGVRGTVQETGMLDLLEHYGARVERNLIMDASCGMVQIPRNVGFFTINERFPYPFFVRIFEGGFASDNPAVSSQSELMLAWPSSITLVPDTLGLHQNVTASTLFTSSVQSWEVTANADLNPQQEYHIPSEDRMRQHILGLYLSGNFGSYFDGKPIPSVRERSPEDEDDEEEELTGLSQINLHGNDRDRSVTPSNTGGHLVVIGDANFITAQNATRPNVTFMLNLVDWLSLDNNLIAIRSRVLRDKTINPNILEEGSSKPNMIRFINLLLMPVIVAAIGLFISLRRRESAPAATAAVPTADNNSASTADNKENSDNG
ncbi:MAG: GldG family protein [Chitinispirillales bacterium]|jgi:gliding-associated putative ABC transporter substrate-binding component GldG|nr:GldG family protein [Chitinispirillales bacterium]